MKEKNQNSIFMMINIPNIVTLGNLAAGVLSIFLALSGQFSLAAAFIILAVVFDGLDGTVARHLKMTSALGKELDSLCDLVSFGVAPAVFAFQYTRQAYTGWAIYLAVTIYILFVIAGALRLARFNLKSLDHFEGMPITANGIIVPALHFLGLQSWYPVLLILSAGLMVSTFKIKKIGR
ncbi:MAG: CDP-diacylglycerol--serine O-phosphatidyltransferase [Candidatus Woesearchaeota archaeon]